MLALQQHGLRKPDLDRDIGYRDLVILVDLDSGSCGTVEQFVHRLMGRGFVHVIERVDHVLGHRRVRIHQDTRDGFERHVICRPCGEVEFAGLKVVLPRLKKCLQSRGRDLLEAIRVAENPRVKCWHPPRCS
jgi:hypothetical protein